MAALDKDRNTPRTEGDIVQPPMKGATTIFAGSLVCVTATGFAVPGAATATLIAIGRADERKVNAGADGADTVKVRRGTFRFNNSAAADAVTWADYGKPVYVVDDQTVAKTSNANARPVAGTCRGVDANGVWVEF